MFVEQLTFDEVDKVLEKVFPIVFNKKIEIKNVLKLKNVVVMNDYIEVGFKIDGKTYFCYLTDYNIDFSFFSPKKDDANKVYHIFMGKKFIKRNRKGVYESLYLSKLDEYKTSKWREELSEIKFSVNSEVFDELNEI